jgi:outer membrane PBP1 activator LpoA protein
MSSLSFFRAALVLCVGLVFAPNLHAQNITQSETLLRTAESAFLAKDAAKAESVLSTIPGGTLDPGQVARGQMLRAEIALSRKLPQAALRVLPANSSNVPEQAPRMEALRARIQFEIGDAAAAVRTLVARERYLRDAATLAENRERIWNGLIATPVASSDYVQLGVQDSVARGWLELAWLMQQGARAQALSDWSRRYQNHPGAAKAGLVRGAPETAVAPSMPAANPSAYAYAPASISGGYALLLPLSGSLAAAGAALRDGFLYAYWSDPEPRPPVRIYDAGSSAAQAVAAYESALREGAGLVVGPLVKEGVAAVAQRATGAVPIVALNYLDGVAAPRGMFQLGLAPEDEAAAVAERAAIEGRTRSLLLIPANDWGGRVGAAFAARMQALGGSVIESARYPSGAQDYGTALKTLLNLDSSEARHRSLNAVLGKNTEFEPRPRGDADFIFVAAGAEDARTLMPQLPFFRGGDLPVYATSAAYSGSTGKELEGMRFCDMPWMIDAAGDWADARTQARTLFPQATSAQPRLFALGTDAFRLSRQLARGGAIEMDGAGGRLLSGADGRVVRRLSCAQISGGRLRNLQ